MTDKQGSPTSSRRPSATFQGTSLGDGDNTVDGQVNVTREQIADLGGFVGGSSSAESKRATVTPTPPGSNALRGLAPDAVPADQPRTKGVFADEKGAA